jgi:hypothetical protein
VFKPILALFTTVLGVASPGIASLELGEAKLAIPDGWSVVQQKNDRITLKSSVFSQQTTLSLLRFSSPPSFDDFKKLCAHRIDGERRELVDGFVQPEEPYERAGMFGMFFYGGDKATGRVFSGYLSTSGTQLITIVEGIRADPKGVLEVLQKFVEGLRRP